MVRKLFLITEVCVPWRLLKYPNAQSLVSLFPYNTPPTMWSGCGHHGKWRSKPASQSVGKLKCEVPGYFTNPHHHFFFLLLFSMCWRIMRNRMLLAAVIGVVFKSVQSLLFGDDGYGRWNLVNILLSSWTSISELLNSFSSFLMAALSAGVSLVQGLSARRS